MHVKYLWLGFVGCLCAVAIYRWQSASDQQPGNPVHAESVDVSGNVPLQTFRNLRSTENAPFRLARQQIEENWQPGYTVMLLETISAYRGRGPHGVLYAMMSRATGQTHGTNRDDWYRWVWSEPEQPHPDYAAFKSELYSRIDPRFAEYFEPAPDSLIRLDEVRWGGVLRDGIPPLEDPKVIPADEAVWMEPDNVVFGVQINGESRCYPRRILAWHELVNDTVGERKISGVYCTLCGSMIIYDPVFKNTHHKLGTSGFLFRSNKLMYDTQTHSLWSTLEGRPVVGPLVGQEIALDRFPVVTTTWREWLAQHPETTVLSLETGHQRNYDEGVAYQDYFSTDQLMFDVPLHDNRLANKQPVLTFRDTSGAGETLAISTSFLASEKLYHDQFQGEAIVVLTDVGRASRAYLSEDVTFTEYDGLTSLIDSTGRKWTVTEDQPQSPAGRILKRIPTHEAFWFGWVNQFPDTRLVALTDPNPENSLQE